ncbi:hypothetical protein FOCC_FOCC007742 [Frankliniella occidentalis]|nr:hypothetical protein FOCC_FOCC007742 [Frankliniella occidentalis]
MVEDLTKSQTKMLERVFQDYDKGKTGKINVDEIYDMMEQIGAGLNKAAIQTMIQEVDTWGNGYITTDQLREILWELDGTIGVEDMNQIMEEIDADGSGTVDFEEFLAVMMGGEEEKEKKFVGE